jgi:hypothetical protein
MRTQVIAEEDMALDLRIASLKGVEVVAGEAISCFGKVPAVRNPMFAPGRIPEALEPVGMDIQRIEIPNYQNEINDGFGLDSRYGSTADMVRLEDLTWERSSNLVGLSRRELLPLGIERLKHDSARG